MRNGSTSTDAPVRPATRFAGRRSATLAACAAGLAVSLSTAASAETRALSLFFTHTQERATIVFKRDGRYVPEGLQELNRFLRDWRRNEPTKMDPALFDLVWEVYRETGATEPIHVVSAYRSPETNGMLRSRSRGVAKFSRHMRGQAMDFFIPGVSVATIRAIGLRKQVGGVGFYPSSNFVHLDTGNVRMWPRMTRQQLMAVFPNGKTIHLPADGKPLAGYEQAMAEWRARNPSRTSDTRLAQTETDSDDDGSGNWLTRVFGFGGDQPKPAAPALVAAATPRTAAPAVATRAPVPAPAPVAAVVTPSRPVAPEPKPAIPGTAAPGSIVALAKQPTPAPRAPGAIFAAAPAAADMPMPGAKPRELIEAEPVASAPVVVAAAPPPVPGMPRAKPGTETAPVDVALVAPPGLPTPSVRPGQVAIATPAAALPHARPRSPFDSVDAGTQRGGLDPLALGYAAPQTIVPMSRPPVAQPVAAKVPAPAQPLPPPTVALAALGPTPQPAPAVAAPTTLAGAVQKGTRAAIRREVIPVAALADTLDNRLLDNRYSTRTSAFAVLRKPDDTNLSEHYAKPRQALAEAFGATVYGNLRTDRFHGAAIPSLVVVRLEK